jgi:ubiquinone/menaquinone biosynthesis C-methylase UbiE
MVADGMHLPFKSNVFDQIICSEVLEHLIDDRLALEEMSRVMELSSQLILTFPHRKVYFAYDDRFVNHLRRYELIEMTDRLKAVGLSSLYIQKVLGPLEKVTMCLVLFCFSLVQKYKTTKQSKAGQTRIMQSLTLIFRWVNLFYVGLVWLDAKIMPRSLATVLLIKAEREP